MEKLFLTITLSNKIIEYRQNQGALHASKLIIFIKMKLNLWEKFANRIVV